MLGFLFVDRTRFAVEDEAVAAPRRGRRETLAAARSPRCAALEPPTGVRRTIEEALREALWSTASGSSPRSRSARCGSPSPAARVSPPLFESMELLGARPVRWPGSPRCARPLLIWVPAPPIG